MRRNKKRVLKTIKGNPELDRVSPLHRKEFRRIRHALKHGIREYLKKQGKELKSYTPRELKEVVLNVCRVEKIII